MICRRLSVHDFEPDTLLVARMLLGKYLVIRQGASIISGCISETEAYCGEEDKACHASKGRTARTEVMFGPPGYWYVYMIYGMYHCLNIVTEPVDRPCAVLIRGVTDVAGLSQPMKTDGPGKLCKAFGINRTYNSTPACESDAAMWIEDRGDEIHENQVMKLPRIGVHYAGEYKDIPWRFLLSEYPVK